MIYALVDCDNFFASCERAANPMLATSPVAVLSNNDGCVIARSEEVKAVGVKMGQPYHECESLLNSIDAVVLSANFLLYRQYAKRIQAILARVPALSIDVYSIDESFIAIDDADLLQSPNWPLELRELIFKWTGIPVTVGVGNSRALAKVATGLAKKLPNHVLDISQANNSDKKRLLSSVAIGDVWGVGRKLAPKLSVNGIRTAYDLATVSETHPVHKILTSTEHQLINELCGWQHTTVQAPVPRKTMLHSRTFGQALTDQKDVRSAVASFVDSLATKLRRHKLVAGHISVSIMYRDQSSENVRKTFSGERMIAPTHDVFALEQMADMVLREIFVPGKSYKRAGVLLSDLRSEDMYQMSFYSTAYEIAASERLMRAIDSSRERHGSSIVSAVSLLGDQKWRGKHQKLSPFTYTTWDSIPTILS